MSDSKMISVTGLWKNTDKNGNVYLSGTLGGARILVFANKQKKTDKHPDYTICLAPNEKKETADKPQEETPF